MKKSSLQNVTFAQGKSIYGEIKEFHPNEINFMDGLSYSFPDFKKQLDNLNFNNKLKIDYAIQKIPKDRVKPFGTADAVFQTMDQIEILKNSSLL